MNKKFPLVSIIIDNWNGNKFLDKCLSSVFSQKYPDFETILIDDASVDDSAEQAKKKFSQITLISNKKHVGFAKACNQGAEIAKGKYLLFLNNDTVVTPSFLFPLVEDLENDSRIAIAQPKILNLTNRQILDEVVNLLTPFGFLYHYGFGEKDSSVFNRKRCTFSPKGACFITRKAIFSNLRGLDERFYCYFEETDYAWRTWLAGFKVIFEPASTIYHFGGGSLSQQTSTKRDYFSFRNRLNSLITNLSFFWLVILLPLHFVFLSFCFLSYIIRGQWKHILVIPKALFWNIFELKNTLTKRHSVQGDFRAISDKELFFDNKLIGFPPFQYYGKFLLLYNKTGLNHPK